MLTPEFAEVAEHTRILGSNAWFGVLRASVVVSADAGGVVVDAARG